MIKIIFIETDGKTTEVAAEAGESLMRVAVNAGVAGIAAECGGACACGTCHCYVAQDWLDRMAPAGDDERDMLEFVIEPRETSRLSCQVTVTADMDGLVIDVPASQT